MPSRMRARSRRSGLAPRSDPAASPGSSPDPGPRGDPDEQRPPPDCPVILGVDVASVLLGGVAAGMVLFIVSVGLSVTMGLMGFVNLAHGGFAMLGGYAIVHAMKVWGLGFAPALVFGFVVTAAGSAVLERLLYARLYRATEL